MVILKLWHTRNFDFSSRPFFSMEIKYRLITNVTLTLQTSKELWCGIRCHSMGEFYLENASLQLQISFCLTWLLRSCWRRKAKPNQCGDAFWRFAVCVNTQITQSYTELVDVFGTWLRAQVGWSELIRKSARIILSGWHFKKAPLPIKRR